MRDSERMRFRLGAYCRDISSDRRYEIVRLVERETGIRVPLTGGYPDLDRFFQKNSLRDVLDAITYVYRVFVANRYIQEAEGWKRYAGRVLAEEHTTYVLTDDCHVTFAVDEIYAATRTATLAGLSYPHWSEARTELERAFEALDRDPPDTNGAIRAIAASVESASKVILGSGVSRVAPPKSSETWLQWCGPFLSTITLPRTRACRSLKHMLTGQMPRISIGMAKELRTKVMLL